MNISRDKKNQILAERKKLSVHELSKKYNLPKNEIKRILEVQGRKPPKWFSIVLVLIPILFFVLLEISLRVFDYNYDLREWVTTSDGKYIINPDVGKRYFSDIKFNPTTTEDVFDQQKEINSFRVFVLGGSSAAGYPFMPLGSFSRYIKRRLELVYPNNKIEVVNISMTGVNSYTLLDLMPGLLKQKPDLILIYAGHNEFYGALGVGSTESLGSSRTFIRLTLYLNRFKIVQLVRNTIHWFTSLFTSGDKENPSSTLMSRMAKDQQILLNSDKFNAGIEQFEDNLKDILKLAKENNIPVVVGRLVSNLKDQKPFVSVNTPGYQTANQIFDEGKIQLEKYNIHNADSLFRLAKDLDALRFRAPEELNNVIYKICKEFNVKTAPIDSLFDSDSPDGVVGGNLIVDHLHPNIRGNQLIGKAFYEVMEKSGYLPRNKETEIPFNEQDSLTLANFIFSDLDSTIGNYTITLLKNDWPFTERKMNHITASFFKPENFIDSISLEYIEKKITWADAHAKAAIAYLKKDDIANHLKYINILVYQYPVLRNYNTALKYLYERNKIDPRDFTDKRIGIIALFNHEYDDAIRYLTSSLRLNSRDKQVLYNLSLAYFHKKDLKKAQEFVNKCLDIDPKNSLADSLKKQIEAANKI